MSSNSSNVEPFYYGNAYVPYQYVNYVYPYYYPSQTYSWLKRWWYPYEQFDSNTDNSVIDFWVLLIIVVVIVLLAIYLNKV